MRSRKLFRSSVSGRAALVDCLQDQYSRTVASFGEDTTMAFSSAEDIVLTELVAVSNIGYKKPMSACLNKISNYNYSKICKI
jgi:hypothetical protein